jgi:hypothetical protein
MNRAGAQRLVRVSRIVQTCGRVVDERAPLILTFWVLAAVVLTVVGHPALWRQAFAYSHAWASANFAIAARSFVEHGVVALGGIPIQNNDPLGAYPDAYLHWPPLFPMVLSVAFRVFGEAEAVAHGLMLVVLLANVVAMYALVKSWAGREAGLFAAFALLVFPITARYGHLVIPEYPAILATLLALLAFIRATEGTSLSPAWAGFGTICLMLAIGAAWQPLMMTPGLLIAAIWNRSRAQVRLALSYLFASGAALVIVLGVYGLQWPDLWSDLVRTALYRTGITDFEVTRSHLHTIVNDALYSRWSIPSWRVVLFTYVGRLDLIGEVATIAIGTALALVWGRGGHHDGRGSARLVLGGLLAMWVLWFAVMVNHAYQHDMLMLLAAPAASAAVGLSGKLMLDLADRIGDAHTRRVVRWGALVVLPAVLVLTLPLTIVDRVLRARHVDEDVSFGRAISEATEPGSVVMVRTPSLVPVYYSRRHLIRGIQADDIVDTLKGRISEEFPGAPVYLALRPHRDIEKFPRSLERLPLVTRLPDLVLLAVTDGRSRGASRTPVASATPSGVRQ